ncbi:hypothetical protein ACHHRT_13805 [Desulfurivibrio sp. D14AmB]|uniref:hypothetical protein n=1 Tax=Desulfurivibrio sp. D14AmB TaxID=3374370 RepID=UPI00376F3DD3
MIVNPIRCRWDVSAYVLAVAWFLFYVLGIGGVPVVIISATQNFFLPDHPLTPTLLVRDSVSIISLALALAIFWRLCLCLKSDIRRVVRDDGGTFFSQKRIAKGVVGAVAYEIIFDRSFLDFWPHPRGWSDKTVCGKEIRREVGGYNPKYMRRLSEIRLWIDLEKPLSRRVRLCPGNSENEIIDDTLAVTGQWRHAFEESFGTEPGDWELELEQNSLSALIRSGTWEGTTFAGKVRKGIELMHQMADDLASIGHLETN